MTGSHTEKQLLLLLLFLKYYYSKFLILQDASVSWFETICNYFRDITDKPRNWGEYEMVRLSSSRDIPTL